MKLMYPNHFFDPGTLGGASNEVATLPTRNVLTVHKARVWRTDTSGSTQITFTPTTANDFKFFAAWRASGVTVDGYSYGTSSGTATPVASGAMTDTGTLIHHEIASNLASTKYYSFTITSVGGDDIGVLHASPVVTLDQDPDSRSLQVEWVDRSARSESISGQVFSEVGAQYRRFSLSWSNASNTLKTQVEALFNEVGVHEPFFMQISTTSPYNEMLWVVLTETPTFTAGVAGLWNCDLQFQDAL